MKLGKSQVVYLLIPVLFLPREATPGRACQWRVTLFSSNGESLVIKEHFLSQNMLLSVTKGRRSDHGSIILNFHAPDSTRVRIHVSFFVTSQEKNPASPLSLQVDQDQDQDQDPGPVPGPGR